MKSPFLPGTTTQGGMGSESQSLLRGDESLSFRFVYIYHLDPQFRLFFLFLLSSSPLIPFTTSTPSHPPLNSNITPLFSLLPSKTLSTMSSSKRPISVSDELRDQLEGHLDDLVNSGEVELPPGKRIRLDHAGVPKLVEIPLPAISEQRLRQLHDHVSGLPSTRSAEWVMIEANLDDLIADEELRDAFTHLEILGRIEQVQKLVVEDFEDFVGLAQELEHSLAHIKDAKFAVDLPRLVGRILHEAVPRGLEEMEVFDVWTSLKNRRRGVYVLINHICQCHHDAKANPSQQRHFGKLASHCLQTLVTAMAPWDPRNDMDHEVFRSLRERVDEIRRGNREASPEVDDGTEDRTEDGTEH